MAILTLRPQKWTRVSNSGIELLVSVDTILVRCFLVKDTIMSLSVAMERLFVEFRHLGISKASVEQSRSPPKVFGSPALRSPAL